MEKQGMVIIIEGTDAQQCFTVKIMVSVPHQIVVSCTGDLIPGVNTRPRKMEADFTLLRNRHENSQKAKTGKNTKN